MEAEDGSDAGMEFQMGISVVLVGNFDRRGTFQNAYPRLTADEVNSQLTQSVDGFLKHRSLAGSSQLSSPQKEHHAHTRKPQLLVPFSATPILATRADANCHGVINVEHTASTLFTKLPRCSGLFRRGCDMDSPTVVGIELPEGLVPIFEQARRTSNRKGVQARPTFCAVFASLKHSDVAVHKVIYDNMPPSR
jgi:hypothetical protein